MIINQHKQSIRKIAAIGLYLLIFLSSINFTQAAGSSAPANPATPPSTSSDTALDNSGKVTQPPIIPGGATSEKKLFLPHDLSQDSNLNYVQNRLLPGITSMIIGLTGGLSLIFVILSGIQLLTSYADSAAMDKAKKTLTYAIAGIIISSLSYAIVAIISSIKV